MILRSSKDKIAIAMESRQLIGLVAHHLVNAALGKATATVIATAPVDSFVEPIIVSPESVEAIGTVWQIVAWHRLPLIVMVSLGQTGHAVRREISVMLEKGTVIETEIVRMV